MHISAKIRATIRTRPFFIYDSLLIKRAGRSSRAPLPQLGRFKNTLVSITWKADGHAEKAHVAAATLSEVQFGHYNASSRGELGGVQSRRQFSGRPVPQT